MNAARKIPEGSEAFKRAHLAARKLGMGAYAYKTMGHDEPAVVAAQIRNEAQAILTSLELEGTTEGHEALDRLVVLALALAGER